MPHLHQSDLSRSPDGSPQFTPSRSFYSTPRPAQKERKIAIERRITTTVHTDTQSIARRCVSCLRRSIGSDTLPSQSISDCACVRRGWTRSIMDDPPLTPTDGRWAVGGGRWVVGCGRWTWTVVGGGVLVLVDGRNEVEGERWAMDGGRWKMGGVPKAGGCGR